MTDETETTETHTPKYRAILETGYSREDRQEIVIAVGESENELETAANTYFMEHSMPFVAARVEEDGRYIGVTSWEPDEDPNEVEA
jgi:hypothetical protein